jgi:hypothetical protein
LKVSRYSGQLLVVESSLNPDEDSPPPRPVSYTLKCSATDVERASGVLGFGKSGKKFSVSSSSIFFLSSYSRWFLAPMLVVKGVPYESKVLVELHKSEHIPSSTKPSWQPFTLEVAQAGILNLFFLFLLLFTRFLQGGLDSRLVFEVYSYESPTKSEFIGSFTTSLREVTLWRNQAIFAIVNPSKSRYFFSLLLLLSLLLSLSLSSPLIHVT